jgi:hypothetical protein
MSYTYLPQAVEQTANENEISWQQSPATETGYLLESNWTTVKTLVHISNPATGDLRSRTQALVCSNFQITDLPQQISGIELQLLTDRNGRIVDEIIQLTYQGQPIGSNNFVYKTDSNGHLPINNTTTYGGPDDLWDAEITAEMLQDPSFGVILKFQSHPYYPHNSGMRLKAVSLTVY